jgi:hypothetical protein
MAEAQVPRLAEVIGPGIDALKATRPTAFAFAYDGRYADLFAGWQAQAALVIQRFTDECVAARIRLAKGDALTQLASSEFETERASAPTQAIGVMALSRISGTLPGGAIPKGFRFRRSSVPDYLPPVPGADWESIGEISVPLNSPQALVPVIATRPGSAGNAPYFDGDNSAGGAGLPVVADAIFDTNLSVIGFESAGGSDGEGDEDLRRQAMAFATGQFAPDLAAIVAGTLIGTGVHRAATFEVPQIQVTQVISNQGVTSLVPAAFTAVCIADQSWSSGSAWQKQVQQSIADTTQGFGCAIVVSGVRNTRIRLVLSVKLRDAKALTDVTEIDAAIISAARAYFDDRPDWYTWKLAAIRAVISRAHPKIQVCTLATVRALVTDAVLTEPTGAPIATANGIQCTHYELASNGVITTYTAAT